jgi:predicted metalloprotease
MTFRDDVRLDPSRIQRRGASTGARGMAIGGGLGGLVLLLIGAFLGVDLTGLGIGGDTGGSTVAASDPEAQSALEQACQTGADANERRDCLIVGTVSSLDAYWSGAVESVGVDFSYPSVVLYDNATSSACGTASDATGPFYCPPDRTIYVDTTFFDILVNEFGSSDGQLAEEYVIAHEYGHFIQDLLGVFDKANRSGTGADSDSVQVELMADCLAGVWANHAEQTGYLTSLSDRDVRDALAAANSVGDDHIQQATRGEVDPDLFTHGTSAQREQAFLSGYRTGLVETCDYFDVVD